MNEFIVWDENDNLVGYEFLSEKGRWTFILENEGIERIGNICPSFDKKLFKLPYIHKTDINGKKIYAQSSIVEFYFQAGIDIDDDICVIGYFSYNNESLRYEIKDLNTNEAIYLWTGYSETVLSIIDTIQENKLGLIK